MLKIDLDEKGFYMRVHYCYYGDPRMIYLVIRI